MRSRPTCLLPLLAGLIAGPSVASAQEAPPPKIIGAPSRPTPSLIVMNAHAATLEGGKLTLTGATPSAIVFADRPVRAAGHAPTARLIDLWRDGGTFAKDPPNATVSVLSRDASVVRDAVVVLKSAAAAGDRVSFDVQVLEGDLNGADGPVSLFIDTWNFPFLTALANGGARSQQDNAAWYKSYGDYAQPTPSDQLGPAFMNNGLDTTPWQN